MAKTQTKGANDRENVERLHVHGTRCIQYTISNFKEATMRISKTEMPVTHEGDGYVFRETT